MKIKLIGSVADHHRAFKEIGAIFDAIPGTPDGDRLEVLVTHVEVYEAALHPVEPPEPIEAILYHLESRGLARSVIEPHIGRLSRA